MLQLLESNASIGCSLVLKSNASIYQFELTFECNPLTKYLENAKVFYRDILQGLIISDNVTKIGLKLPPGGFMLENYRRLLDSKRKLVSLYLNVEYYAPHSLFLEPLMRPDLPLRTFEPAHVDRS